VPWQASGISGHALIPTGQEGGLRAAGFRLLPEVDAFPLEPYPEYWRRRNSALFGPEADWQTEYMWPWRQCLCALAVVGAADTGKGENACAAFRLAIADLAASFPSQYTNAPAYLARLDVIAADLARDVDVSAPLEALRREALLTNPLLDFDQLLVVRRSAQQMGLPANWQGNSSLRRTGFANEIAVLSNLRSGGDLTTLYRPPGGEFVGDLEPDFDASRLLFSMPAGGRAWRVSSCRSQTAPSPWSCP